MKTQTILKKLALTLLLTSSVLMQCNTVGASPTCENGDVLSGKLISDVCWNCIFPIRVVGFDISGDGGYVPDDAASGGLCVCDGPGGVPSPGFTVGMWQPAYLIETTRTPGCAMSLNGTDLGFDKTALGTSGSGSGGDDAAESDTHFKHYHFYRFPLLAIMDMLTNFPCAYDGATTFDVVGMSEISDPIWYSDNLAFFANPEVAVVANPIAQMACIADSASVNAGAMPISSLFWCAGSWGSIYPFSGNEDSKHGIIHTMSNQGVKLLATNHRRGFMWGTVGNGALCGGEIKPVFPKQQYKLNMFYPRPETSKSHFIGASELRWGFAKYVPMSGEDQIVIASRWSDCCYRMIQ